ncbi:TonB-dependent receptor [Rhodoferax sp. AJA081-3]|uniref:TonB-dependent receptor domain-containing protein n=1 Tax=Rhodoferax sp. AJA081-3 TaxID=2752316 RepID=UPI001AE0DAAE|nr:TonB-dependent receptor [Rhodoferax sp. AJA081-3]QTN27436.1 TonB-dependent receptor [Rhodoferax sp. AJA081-3]
MQYTCTRPQLLALVLCGCTVAVAHAGFAEIIGLSGKGDYRPDGNGAWLEAKLKVQLEPSWWVRTGPDSHMALVVAPEVQIKLAANSIFQLRKDEKTPGTTLNLRQGRAWSQSKQPSGTLKMETPSAIAAIHGTDWEMVVDAEGRSTLTVLHGSVQFGNTYGTVRVGNGEQALAEPGKAPVKRILVNPAERVQWVSAVRVEPDRYAEYRGDGQRKEVIEHIAREDWLGAESLLRSQASPLAADTLLLADLALRNANFAEARALLERGAAAYPMDGRFPAALSRLALIQGDGAGALKLAQSASERFAQTADAWLALGEAAYFEGLAKLAQSAFRRAETLDPADGRASLGLARIAIAREDLAAAYGHLAEAQKRTPQLPSLAAEQGNLATTAYQWNAARTQFDVALRQDPQDYTALSGLAQLQLRHGERDAAMETILRSNLLEPRYARTYLYRAAAHHQRGESDTALEFLRQATERDPQDPLPHLMASLVHQDRGELFAAAVEARKAKEKLPFLKSLDALAMDQKGSANIGSALSKLGMASWARYYAAESNDALWAGSHFFLADQTIGSFTKASELVQGYLTDPLALGANPRMQSLLPEPGNYLTLGARMTNSKAFGYSEPSVVVNGSHYAPFPVAWFFEGLRNELRPGQQDLDARGNAYTLALGAKPTHDVALFAFANQYVPEIERMGLLSRERITGHTRRLDAGGSLRLDPDTQVWLKLGEGSYTARTISLQSPITQDQDSSTRVLQLRTTWRAGGHEVSAGVEAATTDAGLLTRGRTLTTTTQEQDDFRLVYAQGRYALANYWSLEGGLAGIHYRKAVQSSAGSSDQTRDHALPMLGAVWRPSANVALRAAWHDWVRSNAPHSLRPTAIAGIPVDDQLTLPGGRQQRLRLQADWEMTRSSFVSAFVDARTVRNLGEAGFVLNTAQEVSDINRLRDRGTFQNGNDPERLEGQPVFAEGSLRQLGLVGNAVLGNGFAANTSVVLSDSRNTSEWFKGLPLPYLPRHRVGLGLDWSNAARLTAGATLVWRSEQLTTEYGNEIPASWDLALRMKWESTDKRWQLESWAAQMLKKAVDPTIGIAVLLRY